VLALLLPPPLEMAVANASLVLPPSVPTIAKGTSLPE
jgi:hypothetical protein